MCSLFKNHICENQTHADFTDSVLSVIFHMENCLVHSVNQCRYWSTSKIHLWARTIQRINNSYILWLSPRDPSKSFASAPFTEATQKSSEVDTCVLTSVLKCGNWGSDLGTSPASQDLEEACTQASVAFRPHSLLLALWLIVGAIWLISIHNIIFFLFFLLNIIWLKYASSNDLSTDRYSILVTTEFTCAELKIVI